MRRRPTTRCWTSAGRPAPHAHSTNVTANTNLTGFQAGSGQTFCFNRSAINSHKYAIIMSQVWYIAALLLLRTNITANTSEVGKRGWIKGVPAKCP